MDTEQQTFLRGADVAVRRLSWLQNQLNGIRNEQDLKWRVSLYARFVQAFGNDLAGHLYYRKLCGECEDNAYEWFAGLDERNKLLFLTHQAFA